MLVSLQCNFSPVPQRGTWVVCHKRLCRLRLVASFSSVSRFCRLEVSSSWETPSHKLELSQATVETRLYNLAYFSSAIFYVSFKKMLLWAACLVIWLLNLLSLKCMIKLLDNWKITNTKDSLSEGRKVKCAVSHKHISS